MKRLFVLGGASLLLLLGILIGAVYGNARVANASTKTTTVTAATTPTTTNYCSVLQQNLARRLGVTADKLTSAEAAAAKDTIDQMVKDGKITQAQATQIEANLGDATKCQFKGKGFDGKLGQGNMLKVQKYLTAAEAQVAQGLGISSADLTSQLQSGKSLHDVATAHKVSDTQLKALLNAAIQSELNQAITAGDITKAQADMLTKQLTSNSTFLDRIINGHKGDLKKGMDFGAGM